MKTLASVIMFLFAVAAMAQGTVTGTVIDAQNSEPIVGAAIVEQGTTNGTVTDIDGKFTLKIGGDANLVKITYLGYKDQYVSFSPNKAKSNLGTVKLEIDSKALDDVVVVSTICVTRKTPVALSTIDPVLIEEKLGTQEFPEILKSTPGVHASKDGGGYGDSKINMRGFQSANVAVVVNGVPMNDMEWGGVYWSNWTGLADVTRSMQTQRGLGASKISSPSVGGTINIVTKSIDAKQGGTISYAIGNDGYNKITASVSTGMNSKGWAFNLLLARTWGDGYIQGTEYEGYNWFANIAKRINDNHQVSITAFGAPQWHNQRSSYDGLTIEGWQLMKDYMKGESVYKYNATYGFGKNGERKTSARNKYHKPQISLNHQWQITDGQSLSTALYTSIGRGYGYSGQSSAQYSSSWYGASNGVLNTSFRNEDGTFAYDKVQELNEQSDHGSEMVMSISKNYHTWLGLVSSYDNKINEDLSLSGGVDFRWYKGVHTNELIDLYNGAYYIDRTRNNVRIENNSAAADPDFRNKKLHVGDIVYRDYDGYTIQGGIFAQAEYTLNPLNFYVSGSVSNTSYWRHDRFYYDAENADSERLNFWAGTIKGGVNYNIDDDYNNVFINAGFISRAPFFSGGAFLNSTVSNATNPDAVNEKIASIEAGYGFQSNSFKATINAYFTKWMDKTMAKTGEYTMDDGTQDHYMVNMEGVDAVHEGIEIELVAKPATWVELTGMLSIGNWVWDCNATGYFYSSTSQPLADIKGHLASGIQTDGHAKMTLNLDKVKVGGSAQTTAALGANFKPMDGLKIGADWTLRARNYAEWQLNSNDIVPFGEKSYDEAWKIPSASTVDVHASYTFKFCDNIKGTFSGNVENLFDQEYVADAYDGAGHDWKSAYRVFYGFGRTYSVRFKLAF